MSPIKILVFAEYGWRNGGENSLLAVVERLKRQFQFTFACPKPSELSKRLDDQNFETMAWQLHHPNGERKSQSEIRWEMQQLARNCDADLIHANSLATARLAGPAMAVMNIPCVGYIRDIIKISKQAIVDVNHCDRLIAVSDATKQFHTERGISGEICDRIYNGIDLERFKPRKPKGYLHDELRLAAATRLILCIGQIGMRKGTDTVINAFQKIHATESDTALLIVGIRNSEKQEAIDFEQNCRKQSSKIKNVFWLGRRTDVDSMMNESSLLLHAARQEPLGRVLLEALASGLPLVATTVGGTSEIIPTEYSHLLCDVDDFEVMAKTATTLLQNSTEDIQFQFRQNAVQLFDVARCAARLARCYDELIQRS